VVENIKEDISLKEKEEKKKEKRKMKYILINYYKNGAKIRVTPS
jgi:hypothetical protein